MKYKICSFLATKNTTIGVANNSFAFPYLFACNDVRNTILDNYDFKESNFRFYRDEKSILNYLRELIDFGKEMGFCPIVVVCQMMAQLQPLMQDLRQKYDMQLIAQTPTTIYAINCMDEKGHTVLRFWDILPMEKNGIYAMAKISGIDYQNNLNPRLIRTKDTIMTKKEIKTIEDELNIYPMFLKWILQANPFLKSEDFGVKVITSTSIVRQMAKRELGQLRFIKQNGKIETLRFAFNRTCNQEFAKDYKSYGIRRACFRGGLTFTSAKFAQVPVENVASLDVTSMHHAFICGRKTPVHFNITDIDIITMICNKIKDTTINDVLSRYFNPFNYFFHAQIRFKKLRLKKNSIFEREGIAILARAKFCEKPTKESDYGQDDRARKAEENLRENGFIDFAKNAEFAFGKLYKAIECTVFLNEIEFWNVCNVYDFDAFKVIKGEATCKAITPPDYVTLQTNVYFDKKNDVKFILEHYKKGEKYDYEIPKTIPQNLAKMIKNGTMSENFLKAYYTTSIKGNFNSIFGIQAQNEIRPQFEVKENGMIKLLDEKPLDSENYDDLKPKNSKVFFTYGMRIAASSRMHLIISMILLDTQLGEKIDVLGGDTDSLKIRCDKDVTDEIIIGALQPLHNAIKLSLDFTQKRNLKWYPEKTSKLENVGTFEIEKKEGANRAICHMEAWNKTRVAMFENGKIEVTCSGISQPENSYTFTDFCEEMTQNNIDAFKKIMPTIFNYNVFVSNEISHNIMRKYPKSTAIINREITDYQGHKTYVKTHENVVFYQAGKWLGDTDKSANNENLNYLKKHYNRNMNHVLIELNLNDGIPQICYFGTGEEI